MNDLLDDDEKPKKKQSAREVELGVIRNTMTTMQGRAMYWRLLVQTGIFIDTFSIEPTVHLLNTGRRQYGLWFAAELREASQDFYHEMLRENQ